MPFGPYKDFADCVKKNKDKENPSAYCASIERKIKDKSNPGNPGNSIDEPNVQELNPQKVAEKFLKGDLPEAPNSYNGYGYGSSSLQNVTPKSKRRSIEKTNEDDIIKEEDV